jgi:lysophospholipase L1-like esterase
MSGGTIKFDENYPVAGSVSLNDRGFVLRLDNGQTVAVPFSLLFNLFKNHFDAIYRTLADSYTKAEVDAIASAGIAAIIPSSANDELAGLKFPTQSGTYVNYGGIVVDLTEGLTIIFSDGDETFTKTVIPIDLAGYATTARVEDIEDELPLKARMFPGKNLFNKNDPGVEDGKFVDETTGLLGNGPTNTATHFIEVEEGKSYVLSHPLRSAWYDASFTYISGQHNSVAVRVAPAGAKYFRCSFPTTNLSVFQFEQGTIPTAFEPFRLRTLKEYALLTQLANFPEKTLFGTDLDSAFQATFQEEFAGEETAIFPEENALWANTTSTFSGWGTPIGTPQNFEGLRFRVRARAEEITSIRVRIYEVDVSGALLHDQTLTVSVPATESRYITVLFPEIENDAAQKIFLLYNCNQFVDRWGISDATFMPLEDGYGHTRFVTDGNMSGRGSNATGSSQKNWFAIIQGGAVIGFTDLAISLLSSKLNIVPSFLPTAEILIPSQLHATQGVELNVFWDNVIFSNFPLDQLRIDVTCSQGAQFARGWRYLPVAETGTFSFNVKVFFGTELITEKTSTIHVQNAAGAAGSKKILCVGDSTTANGHYISLVNSEYGTNPSVTFLGTKGTAPNLHEATSRWNYGNFVGNSSPFYIGGELDFAAYLTAGGWTMDADDLITIHLGINDVFNNGTTSNINTIMGRIQTLVTMFRTAVPNINICLLATIPPSISQDAFGEKYGNGQTLQGYLLNYRNYMRRLLEEWDTSAKRADRIFVAQFNCNLDRTYNFPKTTIPANARTSEQVTYYSDGVHPALIGYHQMGDSLWMFIKNLA